MSYRKEKEKTFFRLCEPDNGPLLGYLCAHLHYRRSDIFSFKLAPLLLLFVKMTPLRSAVTTLPAQHDTARHKTLRQMNVVPKEATE